MTFSAKTETSAGTVGSAEAQQRARACAARAARARRGRAAEDPQAEQHDRRGGVVAQQ